ncbi:hypothetical protein AADZ91_00515 [Colwelliaceae bacterium 6441]
MDKAINDSANMNYQQFITDKNTIAVSKSKFNQLPEAKARKVEVDCSNTFNKGITMLSGLLGGSIKCNSFNGSQQYIDARLKKMGAKK